MSLHLGTKIKSKKSLDIETEGVIESKDPLEVEEIVNFQSG